VVIGLLNWSRLFIPFTSTHFKKVVPLMLKHVSCCCLALTLLVPSLLKAEKNSPLKPVLGKTGEPTNADHFDKPKLSKQWAAAKGEWTVSDGVLTGKDLAEMSLDELRQFSDQITDDVFAVLTLEGSVNARDHIGGTAPAQVRAAVQRGRDLLTTR